jgi:hypothetical protein
MQHPFIWPVFRTMLRYSLSLSLSLDMYLCMNMRVDVDSLMRNPPQHYNTHSL